MRLLLGPGHRFCRFHLPGIALAFLLMTVQAVGAGELSVLTVKRDSTGTLCFGYNGTDSDYYILYQGAAVTSISMPVNMALGQAKAAEFKESPTNRVGFYRLRRVPLAQPMDSDGDGIDDVYELEHRPLLDPLDAHDAGLDSDHDGKSNLQEYLLGSDAGAPEFSQTVYVVDNPTPGSQTEFRELPEAITRLKAVLGPQDLGRAVVCTDRPLRVEALVLGANIRLEVADEFQGRATIEGPGPSPLLVSSGGMLGLSGFKIINAGGVDIKAGGYLILSGNSLPATSVDLGGASVAKATQALRPRGYSGGSGGAEIMNNLIGGGLELRLSDQGGAESVVGVSKNSASTINFYSVYKGYSGVLSLHENITKTIGVTGALWGSAHIEIMNHQSLDELLVGGEISGNPQLLVRQNLGAALKVEFTGIGNAFWAFDANDFRQVQLGLGASTHSIASEAMRCDNLTIDQLASGGPQPQQISCNLKNSSIAYGFTWHALASETATLDVILANLDLKGQFTLETVARGTWSIGEGSSIMGDANITIQRSTTEFKGTRVTYGGDVLFKLPEVNAGIRLQSELCDYRKNVGFVVGHPSAFIMLDLTRAIFGDYSTLYVNGPEGQAQSLIPSTDRSLRRIQVRKEGAESAVALHDIQQAPKSVVISDIDAPVTIENCRFQRASVSTSLVILQDLTGAVTVRNCTFGGGGFAIAKSDSAVTIEDNQFDVTAPGFSALSIQARSAILRNNQVRTGGTTTGSVLLDLEDSALVEDNNPLQGMLGVTCNQGEITLRHNTIQGGLFVLPEAQVTARENTVEGDSTIFGDFVAEQNQFTGAFNLIALESGSPVTLRDNTIVGATGILMRRVTATGTTFIGEIEIGLEAILDASDCSFGSASIHDANPSGGLTRDPVQQGAVPKEVSSLIDFDTDPQHCADYPPSQYQSDGTCKQPGVPAPH